LLGHSRNGSPARHDLLRRKRVGGRSQKGNHLPCAALRSRSLGPPKIENPTSAPWR
jgi:hypothetical protein